MSKYSKKLAAVIITIMALGSNAILPYPTVYGSGTDPSTEKTERIDMGSLGKEVKFLGESTVVLTQIHLIPTDNGQVLYTTIEVKNKSTQELDFYPYWIKMQTKNGGKFPVSIVSEKKNTRIAPSAKETFSYYAVVPNHIEVSDLIIMLIKWDFSMPNYERRIFTFKMPERIILPTIQSGESYVFNVQGIPVNSNISNIHVGSGVESKKVTIQVSYLNQGLRAVKLPAYEYMLKDGEGVSYPVAVRVDDIEANILPRIKKETELTVEIPLEADINDFQLLISEPKKDINNPIYIPLVSYVLDIIQGESESTEAKNINEVAVVKYDGLDFYLSVRDLRVLPTSSFEKVISYDVVLKNKNDKKVAIPDLNSNVFVSGSTPVMAKITEKKTQLMYPDEEIVLNMVATFPEDIDVNGMKVTFQKNQNNSEGVSDAYTERDLATFNVFNRNFRSEGSPITGLYHFNDLGQKSTIKLHNTSTYEYWGSEIIVSSFLIENKDSRPISIPEYIGFFKSTEGELFNANYIGRKDNVISPRRSALITYWAELPKGINLKKLELVLGQALSDNVEVLSEAATFLAIGDTLPKTEIRNQGSYDILSYNMFPYLIKLQGMRLSGDGSSSVQFYVEKSFVPNIITDGEPRTLTFDFVASDGSILESVKEINVEKGLTEGRNKITFNVQDPSMELRGLSVRIYETFDKGRNLVGVFYVDY